MHKIEHQVLQMHQEKEGGVYEYIVSRLLSFIICGHAK